MVLATDFHLSLVGTKLPLIQSRLNLVIIDFGRCLIVKMALRLSFVNSVRGFLHRFNLSFFTVLCFLEALRFLAPVRPRLLRYYLPCLVAEVFNADEVRFYRRF